MNKVDINRNKLEIGDIVVLCDCAEAITRNFEFWEVYADNTFTDHSVFIRGLTSHKSDSFKCCYLKKVDKQLKDHDLDWYKHEYYAECDRADRLEKALDKACEELECYASSYENPWSGRPFTKNQWKEWCLENVK